MTEEELRTLCEKFIEKREALLSELIFVKEELAAAKRALLPFSIIQKRIAARLINGVNARALVRREEALRRAVRADVLRASGLGWSKVGAAMGISGERARQISNSRARLEQDD